jgi:hypothetical protein
MMVAGNNRIRVANSCEPPAAICHAINTVKAVVTGLNLAGNKGFHRQL